MESVATSSRGTYARPTPGRIAAAALLPPYGVYLAEGVGQPFWIATALTCLGFLPGSVYALWTVLHR